MWQLNINTKQMPLKLKFPFLPTGKFSRCHKIWNQVIKCDLFRKCVLTVFTYWFRVCWLQRSIKSKLRMKKQRTSIDWVGEKCIKTIKLQSKIDCFRFYCYPFQLMQKHFLWPKSRELDSAIFRLFVAIKRIHN